VRRKNIFYLIQSPKEHYSVCKNVVEEFLEIYRIFYFTSALQFQNLSIIHIVEMHKSNYVFFSQYKMSAMNNLFKGSPQRIRH